MKLHAKKKRGIENLATLCKREEDYDSSASYLFAASIAKINAQIAGGCSSKETSRKNRHSTMR